ncbi:RsmD family RNA methyltransferase [Candidatus Saccharibacteria bacterium]|nr:RsmD family RNA methyltransferase [Candidatus Saccharibacteria bacterium]
MNNTVRITSGIFRGRLITTPGGGTHPMGERERLALFNMIGDSLSGATVLDVYAGSGALGLEALSRGAREVSFVDSGSEPVRCIANNLITLGFTKTSSGEYHLSCDTLSRCGLSSSQEMGAVITRSKIESYSIARQFDLILADPPYDSFNSGSIERLIGFLKAGGVLVLSHPGVAPELSGLLLKDTRKYAGATISIYTKTDKIN